MKEEKVLVIWTLGLFIPTNYFTYIRGGSGKHSRARGSTWYTRTGDKGKTHTQGSPSLFLLLKQKHSYGYTAQ